MIQILHPDGRVLQLDRADTLGVTRGARPAERPIERGAPAIDHVEPLNDTVQITATITETPMSGAQFRSDVDGYKTPVLANLVGVERVQAASDFLRDCVGEYVDILVAARRIVYTNCLLMQYPHEFRLVLSSPFTLQFVKPRIIAIQTTSIPPRKAIPAEMPADVDAGAGEARAVGAEDRSVLYRGAYGNSDLETDAYGLPTQTMSYLNGP